MWKRVALITAALTLPVAAAFAADGSLIQPPPDAKLVGRSVVDEIRAFPELGSGMKTLSAKPHKEKLVGVAGIDRVFTTDRSFGDTVSYFDQKFKATGYKIDARVETPSSTAWTVKRPDGTVANAVVRNTTPTTIELNEVASATGEIDNK